MIHRLYTLSAKDIIDAELIDDVGYAMFERCESRAKWRAEVRRAVIWRDIVRTTDNPHELEGGGGD